jgi:hypothetical protein
MCGQKTSSRLLIRILTIFILQSIDNRRAFTVMNVNIQGEHKRTLHFQNDTENKCGVLRTSHLHQSIVKHSNLCLK